MIYGRIHGRVRSTLTAVVAALMIASGIAACGTSRSHPSPHRPTASGVLAALQSIPDTAENRDVIVINNLSEIWKAAGLPANPSVRQAASKTGLRASSQIYGGSPAGSNLWDVLESNPTPLGYPALAVSKEIVVGRAPHEISEVWGPISQREVTRAVRVTKPQLSHLGSGLLVTLNGPSLTSPAPFNAVLFGTRYLLLPRAGGRLITGAADVPKSALTTLASHTSVADSLADDPDVNALLKAFGGSVQSLYMSAASPSVTSEIVGSHATAAIRTQITRRFGLEHLRTGPMMSGIAYVGGTPKSQSVVAAALYPSSADARSALNTVARYTATGVSPKMNKPYSTVWHVNATSIHNTLVIMHLTSRFPGAISRVVENADFPLFWSP